MTEPTPEVYEAAARASILDGYRIADEAEHEAAIKRMAKTDVMIRSIVAAVWPAGVTAGRAQAAADIRAHADRWAPAGGNFVQQRLRRHFDIAERVAAGPMTDEEVAQALNEYFAERNLRAAGGEPR